MPGFKRLIVSFLGFTDLNHWPRSERDTSPLYRLLQHLFNPRPQFRFEDTKLLLFYEDNTERNNWSDLVERIGADIKEFGWGGITFAPQRISLPDGPTDLDRLYSVSWDTIQKSAKRETKEEIFNITSGTPAMQACMILAADCLKLNAPRRFQMSWEKEVEEIQLPWAIAYRPRVGPRGPHQRKPLPEEARRGLLPDTILADPVAEEALAGLHEVAKMTPGPAPVRVLIKGPSGSGKWTAARQFAHWRRCAVSEWLDPDHAPEVEENGCLLIRRLDAWSVEQLRALGSLAARRPDIVIVATFRTNQGLSFLDLPRVRETLPGAWHFNLPLPNERDDFIALAEALAKKCGYHDGKLKKRLGYSLYQGVPHGLTGLEQLLKSAGSRSPGSHPDQTVVSDEVGVLQAEDVLTECMQRIVAADYSSERNLPDILADIEKAAVLISLQGRRAKSDVENRIGVGRRKLTQIGERHWTLEK